ncbi:hypothetical protein [Pseudooceanicola sp. LIPI14-2-Ac024]|uniref:hypothetical protein n=1 Tax=Pseudooceanicola sp. LIPI14-2-Ac024 TaxID=3344875 RepID=UPI0035CEB1F9
MNDGVVRFHLDPDLLTSVSEGRHNFLNKVKAVCEAAGMTVMLVPNSEGTRRACAALDGYDLFHMDPPTHDRALTVRRVYHYPFWAIEASAARWEWDVARAPFPGAADRAEVRRFAGFWRQRLFGEVAPRRDGYVYVPLQGRLQAHRSFQACAPLDMIRAVLAHDPDRRVEATLHPGEDYSASDLDALKALEWAEPRLSVSSGEMVRHLTHCDYVVTENSAVAFNGYFFGKPCALFAAIDFHHIAANVAEMGAEAAIRAAPGMQPDFDGYLHWFWQVMSINAGRPEADERIAARLRQHGWPV